MPLTTLVCINNSHNKEAQTWTLSPDKKFTLDFGSKVFHEINTEEKRYDLKIVDAQRKISVSFFIHWGFNHWGMIHNDMMRPSSAMGGYTELTCLL